MKWKFECKVPCIFPSFTNISIMYFIVNWGHAAVLLFYCDTSLHLTGQQDITHQLSSASASQLWFISKIEICLRRPQRDCCPLCVFISSHDGSSSPDRQASSCNFYPVDLANIFSESFNWNLGFKIYVSKVSRNVTECRKEKVQEVVLFHP